MRNTKGANRKERILITPEEHKLNAIRKKLCRYTDEELLLLDAYSKCTKSQQNLVRLYAEELLKDGK